MDAATAAGLRMFGLFASEDSSFAKRPPPPSFIDLPIHASWPWLLRLGLELGQARFFQADRNRLLAILDDRPTRRARVQFAVLELVHLGLHACFALCDWHGSS